MDELVFFGSTDFNLTTRNPWFNIFLIISNALSIVIGSKSTGISYQLKDIYSICRCCWNVYSF